MEKGGWVYFLTNCPNGTLYTGVTSNLIKRIGEHKEGKIPGFTRQYYLKRLVWYEFHDKITAAIQRETNIKHWPRQWKVNLIERENPAWNDLYDRVIGLE